MSSDEELEDQNIQNAVSSSGNASTSSTGSLDPFPFGGNIVNQSRRSESNDDTSHGSSSVSVILSVHFSFETLKNRDFDILQKIICTIFFV